MMVDLQKIANERETYCPFYGFHGAAGIFMDSKGNQCPLRNGYTPCYMKVQNQKPDWDNCNFSNNNSLEDFDSFEVSIHGISSIMAFKDWAGAVMTR